MLDCANWQPPSGVCIDMLCLLLGVFKRQIQHLTLACDLDLAGHDHSPVPDVWPQLSVILQYRDRVRTRVKGLYQTYSSKDPKLQQAAKEPQTDAASLQAAVADTHCRLQWLAVAHMPFEVQHVLWMCYEHEAMHLVSAVVSCYLARQTRLLHVAAKADR